jgi:Zn-dependent protease
LREKFFGWNIAMVSGNFTLKGMQGRWSIQLFKVRGIPLELHATFLLLLGYVAWEGWRLGGAVEAALSVGLVVMLFICVILHELGHSVVAQRYAIPVHRILLLPIGGMAQFGEIPRSPARELAMTAAGPAVNFLIVAILYPFLPERLPSQFQGLQALFSHSALEALVMILLGFNLVMGVFNLIPVFPMDGGRIFRALLALRLPYLQATQIALWVARPLAALGIVYALLILPEPRWLLAILFIFILFGGEMEYTYVRRREWLSGLRVGDLTRYHFFRLSPEQTLGDALRLLRTCNPREIVISQGPQIHGVLMPRDLRRLFKKSPDLDRPLTQLCAPRGSRALDAHWPLEAFADDLFQRHRQVFVVRNGEQLVGVLDSEEVPLMHLWHQRWRGFRHPTETSVTSPVGGLS